MKLIDFPEQTHTIAKDQPQYMPMPAYLYQKDREGRLVCCWQMSWPERLRMLITGRIWHHVLTFNQPLQPQLLSVDKPVMP